MTTRNFRDIHLARRTLAVGIGMALASGAAHADTFQVGNTNDSGAGSFRQAINDANAISGPHTIDFSQVSGETIALEDDLPQLSEDLTLQGSEVTLDGATEHRCLATRSASLSVNDMTITRCVGRYFGSNSDTVDLEGGGIFVGGGDLTVNNSRITNNAAPEDTPDTQYQLAGGGIAVKGDGQVMISGSEISGNTAYEYGGGLHVDVYNSIEISDTTISGNRSRTGIGGAELEGYTIQLSNVTISDNTPWEADGVETNGGGGAGITGYEINIEQSEIRDNRGSYGFGGLAVYSYYGTEIVDSTISGNSTESGVGGVAAYGSLSVTDTQIVDNSVTGDQYFSAGGLFSLNARFLIEQTPESAERGEELIEAGLVSITRSVISGNSTSGPGGGATFINEYGSISIEDTEISDNSAAVGAGMFVISDALDFTLSGSTISGNKAVSEDEFGSIGGGMYMVNKYPGTVAMQQSTISNNSAAYAAGAYLYFPDPRRAIGQNDGESRIDPRPVRLEGMTLTGNTATVGRGGGLSVAFSQYRTAEIAGSIIAGNSSAQGSADLGTVVEPEPPQTARMAGYWDRLAQAFPQLELPDWEARGNTEPVPGNTTFEVSASLIGEGPDDGSTFNTDTTSTDLLGEAPQLGELADNGGPTRTHLPATNSPALNVVTDTDGCGTDFNVDQRGKSRPDPITGQCDAGSVERAIPVVDANPDIDFGSVSVEVEATEPVTLLNDGNGTLEVTGFQGPSAPFSLDFSDCAAGLPFELAAGESCTLLTGFLPAAGETSTQTVTVVTNSVGGDNSFELTGTGLVPGLGFEPLDFGDQLVGQPTQGEIDLTNIGQGELVIDNIALGAARGSVFSLIGDDCDTPIAAGDFCTVTVGFTPPAEGAFDSVLSVSSNAGSEPAEVPLSGQGVIGQLTVSPGGDIDFGEVNPGESSEVELTLTNGGSAPVTVEDWTNLPEPFSISGDCPEPPFTLEPDESCTLIVTFSPESAGDYGESLVFGFDDGTGTGSTALAVSGRGAAPTAPATPIPTLDRLGLIVGSGLLALMGLLGLRRRRDSGRLAD
ncbi:choice-of-anchor D domain-containing protein [Wenzhouxiangella sp. EGI_FJ10305]|uniref:choice-of-anchor D domain-containing protein n=1 Tax=Wenzhouxiangella sp. EGI_FJ10305 TaxID=3243768 RepID=UPI0035E32E93